MKKKMSGKKMMWDKKDKKMETMATMKKEGQMPTKDMTTHAKSMGCDMKGC